MANLIRLTVTEINKLTGVNSYSFNALRIKKVHALNTGSLIYYSYGSDKQSSIIKIKVSESPDTINSQLTGCLDFQIPLNVLSINGLSYGIIENIKTSDIVLGMIDVNPLYSTIWISDISLNKVKYLVNNTLSSIEAEANNYTISGGGVWGGITGTISSQTDLWTYLNFNIPTTIAYTTSIPFTRALTIITGKSLTTSDVFTIASNPVEGGGAQTHLDGDGSHSPDFSSFDYQSGTYSNTSGIRNLITMEYLGGKSYVSILNMTAV